MKKIIVLSGLSGSGNTTVIKELIDLNYFVLMSLKTDNYYEVLENILKNSTNEKIAIFLNVDINFTKTYENILKIKEKNNIKYKQVFLKAQDEVLVNRYQENRKIHPLSKNKKLSIKDCIKIEKELTKRYSEDSHYIIDTSSLITKQLGEIFKSYIKETSKFTINLFSFGFKYGLYQYSDFVFDTRFLKNPYYEKELRSLSGKDKAVRDFVFADDAAVLLLHNIVNMLNTLIPRYKEIGKESISISIGCTGGQHRSVSFVEEISKKISEEYKVNTFHIEEEKGNWQ